MQKEEALSALQILEKEFKQRTEELRAIIESPEKPLSIYDSPSYETACLIKGIDPIQTLPFLDPQNEDQEWHNAAHKLRVIAKVLRNGSEVKIYYPVFNTSGGGFSFDRVFVDAWDDDGSRHTAAGLCVQDAETAKFFGKEEKFIAIWEVFINN